MGRALLWLVAGLFIGGTAVMGWYETQIEATTQCPPVIPLPCPPQTVCQPPPLCPSCPQVVVAPPPQPPPRGAGCHALTWRVRSQQKDSVWVGHVQNVTNPYIGDTPCSETRPMLCFKPGSRPMPAGVTPEPNCGWTGGEVALLPAVLGLEIRSKAAADSMCAGKFGTGWRMAEFHDAGGWGLGAYGELPRDASFWVSINDQRANLWDR